MAIWISRYFAGEPLDDGYVLYRGMADEVYAVRVVDRPCPDDPDEECQGFDGPSIRYTGDIPLPAEHPDDIATDARIMAEMTR